MLRHYQKAGTGVGGDKLHEVVRHRLPVVRDEYAPFPRCQLRHPVARHSQAAQSDARGGLEINHRFGPDNAEEDVLIKIGVGLEAARRNLYSLVSDLIIKCLAERDNVAR